YWRWWWNSSDDDLASYFSGSSHSPYVSGKVSTKDGKAKFKFKVDENDWGRYFVFVHDNESGHSAGKTLYFDWPGWSRYRGGQNDAAAMLMVNTDKEKYEVGEDIEISFPGTARGRALLTIESGSEVLEATWIESMDEVVHYTLKARADMAPNVYAYITLLQPHSESGNDRPIRMYGITPIFVEDPQTILHPVIDVATELRPEKEFTVKVSENTNRPMTYTLAMVDEGLLDLTNFKTPNAWSDFFSREALGVKSWDLYDYVLGAYGGKFERIFSIGGDEDVTTDEKKQVNRFKPVVKFLGPFYLNSGEAEHKITMPNYVGAVRFMVVAGDRDAYGAADRSVPVKSPLMVLSTLPRVLGPGETVKMPVTVFAMKENIKDVEVEVIVNDIIILKEKTKKLEFSETGEQVVYFDLDIAEKVGVGTIEVIARSGSEKASSQTEIEVRNPNLLISKTNTKILEAGDEYVYKSVLNGIIGKNTVIANVSGIPTFDLGGRLQYLIRYPYGCTEQRISSVFPQLFLDDILDLTNEQKQSIERNVIEGINMLKPLQLYNGGFMYWPGLNYYNSWLTSYAGHFLISAEKKGYMIPYYMKQDWIDFQVQMANEWMPTEKYRYGYWYQSTYDQAYRLYTLALAGEPEYGAMNRLRNLNSRSRQATWALAATFATVGQIEVAKDLVKDVSADFEDYTMSSLSFGSTMRDKAFVLITLSLIDEEEKALDVFRYISSNLSSNRWYSTQTTSFCLIGVSEFVEGFAEEGSRLKYDYKINDETQQSVSSLSQINQFEYSTIDGAPIEISFKNNTDKKIFIQLTNSGKPMTGDETNEQENMSMSISYKDEQGNPIDISKLEQGTVFYAVANITNPGYMGVYKDMALSQVLPSGWEVMNYRVGDIDYVKGDKPTYQDIRDDRVYTFFSLNKGTDTFVIMLSASYPGRFYLPFTYCEEMYDNTIYSRKAGQWVEVFVPEKK
ncbi:alpha-2-macroglobulin, partial [Bacteroidota bacterium]